MKHLGPDELVDLVEGAGSSAGRAHVASCDSCRQRFDELGAAMTLASEVDVPEPSPLFWDHLSARVRARIADEPAAGERRAWSWSRSESWRWVLPFALAFGVLLLFVSRLTVNQGVSPSSQEALSAPSSGTAPADVEIGSAEADDSSWTVLAAMSEDLTWDEVVDAGLTVTPGAADRAAMQLTPDEQRELVRLLRAEIGITGT